MTELSNREIAREWLEVLKSAPHADHWVIEEDFVERLAMTWPWVVTYFDLLDTVEEKAKCDWGITLGVYALQQTLGLRFDCAAALFALFLFIRVSRRLSGKTPEKLEHAYESFAQSIEQLASQENEEEEEWLGRLWGKGEA